MTPSELDAFLRAVEAPSLGAYLERAGGSSAASLDERTRWAAWNFRDPEHAAEATFLMQHAKALQAVVEMGEVAWRQSAQRPSTAPTAIPAEPLPPTTAPAVSARQGSPASEAPTQILHDEDETAIDDPTDHGADGAGIPGPGATSSPGAAPRLGLEKTAYGEDTDAPPPLRGPGLALDPHGAPPTEGPSALTWFALGVSFTVVILGATALCGAVVYRIAWVGA